MVKNTKVNNEDCCGNKGQSSCCRIESLVSVDERGQMILPKKIRDKANIKAGDKLAVIGWEKAGEICCITLIKADSMATYVKEMISPMIEEMNLTK